MKEFKISTKELLQYLNRQFTSIYYNYITQDSTHDIRAWTYKPVFKKEKWVDDEELYCSFDNISNLTLKLTPDPNQTWVIKEFENKPYSERIGR